MSDYQPTDRRPIAVRELRISRRLAQWLAGLGVSANAISLAGIGFSVTAGLAFWSTTSSPDTARVAWLCGAGLVQLRLLANMLDGMVAVSTGQVSPIGELYNEVPDRLSDCATLMGLGYAAGGSPALGYMAALVALFTAYVRTMGKVAGTPQDYCGPMAKQQRMFTVTMAALYLGATPGRWQPQQFGVPNVALFLIIVLGAFTAARRLRRAAKFLQDRGRQA